MPNDTYLVHDRVGTQGSMVPVDGDFCIDIPEEFNDDVKAMLRYSEELSNARTELGRLTQVLHNIVNVCNNTEKSLADSKRHMISKLGIGDGNYAIDFNNKKIYRVVSTTEKAPTLV